MRPKSFFFSFRKSPFPHFPKYLLSVPKHRIIRHPETYARRPIHRKSRPDVQIVQVTSISLVPIAQWAARLALTVRLDVSPGREVFQYYRFRIRNYRTQELCLQTPHCLIL